MLPPSANRESGPIAPGDPLNGEAITCPPPPSAVAGSAMGARAGESRDDDIVDDCATSAAGVVKERMQNTSAARLIKEMPPHGSSSTRIGFAAITTRASVSLTFKNSQRALIASTTPECATRTTQATDFSLCPCNFGVAFRASGNVPGSEPPSRFLGLAPGRIHPWQTCALSPSHRAPVHAVI